MNDRLLVGGIAGLAGAVVMVSLNLLLNLIPGISIKLLYAAANLFVPREVLGTIWGSTMGFLVHLICGSLLGVIFIYILELTGYRYIMIKGAAYGLAVWFITCGVVTRLLKLPMQDTFIDSLFLMIIHIPFGLTLAWVIKKYAKLPNTEPQKSI